MNRGVNRETGRIAWKIELSLESEKALTAAREASDTRRSKGESDPTFAGDLLLSECLHVYVYVCECIS